MKDFPNDVTPDPFNVIDLNQKQIGKMILRVYSPLISFLT